jgi:putative endopeptidase
LKPSLSLRVAALGAALLACCFASAAGVSGVDRPSFDSGVRAQDDLFRHVNGTWLKTTEMPGDKVYIGSFESIQDKIEVQLRGLVETAAQRRDDADARRIGDLYTSFMDEAGVEKTGLAPLADELAAIDAITSPTQIAAAMGRLTRLGVNVPIGMSIEQDARDAKRYVPQIGQSGLGLPDRDYYLVADDAKFREAREKYVVYLTRLFALSHASGDAAASAQSVLALETALAKGRWTQVQNRDPVKTYTASKSPRWHRSRPASTGRRGSRRPASPARPATSSSTSRATSAPSPPS